ncbi:TPA_asm: N [Cuscuta gammacytorhabdovirus 2]|nr:TPA_asm: N [Cuscuta gammacytorhabdovirus 2]
MCTIDLSTLATLDDFNDVENVVPSLTGTPEAFWNDADFNRIPGWSNTQLDTPQIIGTGESWLANITANQISIRTVIRGLRLAMSIRSMDTTRQGSLLRMRDREQLEGAIQYEPLPAIEGFSETPFTLRAQQVQPGQNVTPPTPGTPAPNPPQQGEETDASKQAAYTFLAGYLMRLLVKDPENVVSGLNNMKLRFESFYGPSRIISGFTISRMQATAYRDACVSQTKIMTTYTMALAYTQNTGGLDERETGVLSYIGFLPFSYTGMHAYTLLMELKRETGTPPGKLLTLFYADVNRAALSTIRNILLTFERTVENPNRNVYFRYAACWGSHYFASLRSRNCPYLVYTVAAASKTLSATTDLSDPEKIAAVQKLSDQMKRTLKIAGEIIGNSLKQNMLAGARSSMAYSMAMAASNVTPVQPAEGNDWEEFF